MRLDYIFLEFHFTAYELFQKWLVGRKGGEETGWMDVMFDEWMDVLINNGWSDQINEGKKGMVQDGWQRFVRNKP